MNENAKQVEDAILGPLVREWGRLKRAEATYGRIESMGCVEAAAFIPSVAEYIGQLERMNETILRRNSQLEAAVHATHGLLVPLGNQVTPSVLAIREAISMLKSTQ